MIARAMPPCDFPLFVPANRPDRFAKALAASHDAVVFDLEDAVAADDKAGARDALADQADLLRDSGKTVILRINARGTPWHEEDLMACAALPLATVMLPKSESGDDLRALGDAVPSGVTRLALIETAVGLANVAAIANVGDRLVFGSVDFCADLGCQHDRLALLRPRHDLVIASRLNALPVPIDGVTAALTDEAAVRDDAAHAAMLGFGGKLLIHPRQIAAARAGFAPSESEIVWAQKVLAASDGTAVAVDGAMVDAPVLARARSILANRI
ncbi:(3S)-malyl-CoA thioesterase (plasmid) [Sulfitobacter sp. THAF37]|uniref:HpcH/HpaI aldolase/citrate lyase family protein n=1 Tax=Sulfitobacter sp. THAF37 TaxID=2587855 RepID=UPI0012A81461|nr:CoA ester lyase [Sulfitobacter sp. THAF37]QFT61039.1 (3S)-malyl-CoA thioesterase [Sulfitobacter sp. THAF37]